MGKAYDLNSLNRVYTRHKHSYLLNIMPTHQHIEPTTHNGQTIDYELYPLITGAERLAIFQEACGMFEGREEEMLKELAEIRSGFSRELPSIS